MRERGTPHPTMRSRENSPLTESDLSAHRSPPPTKMNATGRGVWPCGTHNDDIQQSRRGERPARQEGTASTTNDTPLWLARAWPMLVSRLRQRGVWVSLVGLLVLLKQARDHIVKRIPGFFESVQPLPILRRDANRLGRLPSHGYCYQGDLHKSVPTGDVVHRVYHDNIDNVGDFISHGKEGGRG